MQQEDGDSDNEDQEEADNYTDGHESIETRWKHLGHHRSMMKVKLRLTGVCHEQVSTVALAVIVGGPEKLHEAASALESLRSSTEGFRAC